MNNKNQVPKAPRDPAPQRPKVYIMWNDMVEGIKRADDTFQDIYYLEGRLQEKIITLSPGIPEDIVKNIQQCPGFRELVHSIGISIIADNKEDRREKVTFELQCKNKNGGYGTCFQANIPCNGEESFIVINNYTESAADAALGSFHTRFPHYMTGKMTVCLYLNYNYQVPDLVLDPPVNFESEAYRQMIANSLLYGGNPHRLKRAIQKAKKGQDVTIAYIGGSITQGAAAKPINTQCYAYRAYQAFCKRFCEGRNDKVHFVKAGMGGTTSELGLLRYEMDVLKYGAVVPDIVIIEFAVNDTGDETNGICYESLALMAMDGLGKPAVILLFAVFMNDFNLQENLKRVGYHYEFPMVSIKDAVIPQFYQQQPVITKRQFFFDLYHPGNDGHRIMSDCLDHLWEQANKEYDPGQGSEIKPPVIGDSYRNIKVLTRDRVHLHPDVIALRPGAFSDYDSDLQFVERDLHTYSTPVFPSNWMHRGGYDTECFELEIACRELIMAYKDSGDQDFGPAEVWADGKKVKTIDPLEVGWNHGNAVIVCSSDVSKIHRVSIKSTKKFTILAFGYVK